MADTAAKSVRKGVLLVALIFGLPIVAFLALTTFYFGMWLPDALRTKPWVVSETTLPDGQRFFIMQLGSFEYSTRFCHQTSDGTITTWLIDGDGNKAWSWPLKVNTATNEVHFDTWQGPATYHWKDRQYVQGGTVRTSLTEPW